MKNIDLSNVSLAGHIDGYERLWPHQSSLTKECYYRSLGKFFSISAKLLTGNTSLFPKLPDKKTLNISKVSLSGIFPSFPNN
jgi:hypothetical protein